MTRNRAEELRGIIETAAASLDNKTALKAVALYPKFDDLAENEELIEKEGFRFSYDGKLYETRKPNFTFQKHYPPGTGTESLYHKIDEEHAGTAEDPIPYSGNMVLKNGKHYTQDGVIYICTRDTVNPVYHSLSDLVGLYVEKV